MNKKKYYLWPLGCAQNISDAERVATVLEENGFTITSEESEADIICVLACSVRQSAIDRIYGRNNIWEKYKKKSLKILSGCVLPQDKKKMEKIFDIIFEIKDLAQLPNLINKKQLAIIKKQSESVPSPVILAQAGIQISIQKRLDPRVTLEDVTDDYFNYLSIAPKHSNSFQALVPISNGCNNFCSYCAVPYTRGREVSRSFDEIVNEVKYLVKNGYKEITLLGQNVNSYGAVGSKQLTINPPTSLRAGKHFPSSVIPSKEGIQTNNNGELDPRCYENDKIKEDDKEKSDFQLLLEELDKIPGKFWIRFISNHPKDFPDNLIETLPKLKKVTPYIHLPLQSGSTKILKGMNRKYTQADYLKLVKKIRKSYAAKAMQEKQSPGVSIGTDTIVGFPGETEKDFEESIKVFEKSKFDMAYIAQYSPRFGTLAAKMKDDIPKEIKKKRDKKLNEVLKKTALENNKKYIGKTVEVLVEKEHKGYLWGRTDTYKLVKFKGRKKLIGDFTNIKIESATAWTLEGMLNIKS